MWKGQPGGTGFAGTQGSWRATGNWPCVSGLEYPPEESPGKTTGEDAASAYWGCQDSGVTAEDSGSCGGGMCTVAG